ncbi:MAG: glucan biosynthesis protein G, partial [Deltaproteobacteria bacterium]|nr:glucan biosynthesis protein G [Deltaproteobacteria bacterium]
MFTEYTGLDSKTKAETMVITGFIKKTLGPLADRAQCFYPLVILVGLLMLDIGPVRADEPFAYQHVVSKARQLAESPFQKPEGAVPKWLTEISYEQWQTISHKNEKSLWRMEHLPFEVQLFHLGYHYNLPVRINVIDSGNVHPINYSTDFFDFSQIELKEKLPEDMAFAGFKLLYPLNSAKQLDEVMIFLGASFFRAVGKGQRFGLSARGLAVDTAQPSGEEFPYFKEFWLQKPTDQSQQIVVFGLLDSPSTTGAYKITIIPGKDTIVNVESTLFQRHLVQKLGLAPLTSMFYYGENTNWHVADNYRPEIHDSDGLSIHSGGGEWLWRPLTVTDRLLVNAFTVTNPQGFGLMQRDLNFDHYQDLDSRFDLRPSAWVIPKGSWGEGHVELIQIPTPSEIHNNVVAFWVPNSIPERGQPIELAYSILWHRADFKSSHAGRVVSTRSGKGRDELERR